MKESTELMEMYAGKICHHDNQNHNHHIIDIGGMLQNHSHYQDQILNNTPLLSKYSTTIITIIVIIILKAEDPPAGKLAKAEKRLEDEVIIISILISVLFIVMILSHFSLLCSDLRESGMIFKFSKILEKFHLSISISSHFDFTFISRSQVIFFHLHFSKRVNGILCSLLLLDCPKPTLAGHCWKMHSNLLKNLIQNVPLLDFLRASHLKT